MCFRNAPKANGLARQHNIDDDYEDDDDDADDDGGLGEDDDDDGIDYDDGGWRTMMHEC